MPGFSKATFAFLSTIEKHTCPPKTVIAAKKWFVAHKVEYENAVKKPCQAVLADIQKRIGPMTVGYEFPKNSFGRLYRDPRKTSERGPFKNWTGAGISPPSKSLYEHPTGIWFQIGAARDDLFVSGGLYMPSSAQMRLMRTAFDSDEDWVKRWERFLNSKKITSRYDKDHGDSLKTFPRGYAHDHPKIKWLRMTQFYLWTAYTRTQATRSDFSAVVANDMKPILEFNSLINEALDEKHANFQGRRKTASTVLDIEVPLRKFDF